MVHRSNESEHDCRFVIRPNRSLNWRQTWIVYLGVCLACLGVATFWAVLGFWPVLPFAGLEMAVLGLCLYRVALSGARTEVVSVRGATVAVEKGMAQPVQRWEFDRAWATVTLQGSGHAWYPSRLLIRSHGREVHIGDFLDEGERTELAGDLRRAIRPC